ncbi:LysE family translocator, partial [Longispora fulva]|uniref:LysE family translocator n=1 Tax=Longispora fulva TaxID=619741 RepID=UPI003631083C
MEETKLFLITFFVALLAVVPPGPVNMSVARNSVLRGKKNGIYVAIGGAIIVAVQAMIAIFLAQYIFDNPFVKNILLRAGLVIFLIMAVYFLVMAKRKKKDIEVSPTSGVQSVFKGIIIGALNVFPIPFYVALGAALNIGGQVEYHLLNNTMFVLGAALRTFTTFYLYSLFFARIETK